MNKKIIISFGASALFITTLLAFPPMEQTEQTKSTHCKQHKAMKGERVHHQKRDDPFMKTIRHLNLSKEQRTKIKAIFKASRDSMVTPLSAFTDTSFDKAKFIQLVQKQKDTHLEHHAQLIADVYQILTTQQKKDLKTMLDMQELQKQKRVKL